MDVLKEINQGLHKLGFSERSGKIGIRVWLFWAIHAVMIMNTTCYLIQTWTDIDDRITTLKMFPFMLIFTIYCLTYSFNMKELSSVVTLIEELNFKIPYKSSVRRHEIISSMLSDADRFGIYWSFLTKVYFFGVVVTPALYVIIKVVWFSEEFQKVIKQTQSTPAPLYYPEFIKQLDKHRALTNLVFYVMGYAWQVIYMVYTRNYAFVANACSMCVSTIVENDLKLLNLSICEMEDILFQQRNDPTVENDELKSFLRYLVLHQQHIYRKYTVVDEGIRCIAVAINITTSLFLCMSLYAVIQKESVLLKLQECVYILTWGGDSFLFSLFGEKITTEHENLRKAFYECSWLDKPKWFKSSLLMAMTRCSKSMDLKPFGLFTLNFRTFLSAMNAAYSYLNLLNKFKSD